MEGSGASPEMEGAGYVLSLSLHMMLAYRKTQIRAEVGHAGG